MPQEIDAASHGTPDWAFHFETGRICLDFVATVGDRAHLAFDRLRTPGDLARWCVEAQLLKIQPAVDAKLLKSARELRESIYRLIDCLRAGRRAPRESIRVINKWAVSPALAPQLGEEGIRWIGDSPVEAVLSTIARDAIGLAANDEDVSRVRECASRTCSVLFLDASRPGRRRWCSMSRCGNRSKKLQYRERLREG